MVSGEVHNDEKIKTMTISTKWTMINFLLSVIGSVSGSLVYDYSVGGLNEIISHRYSNVILYYSSFLPTFVPAAICLGLLFFSEKICSPCCNINLPIVYKTGVDINDFSKIIDLQTGIEYGTNEDEATELNGNQLQPIDSSEVDFSKILEEKQMEIDSLNLQVEALTTQVSELRENQQVVIQIQEFVESF